MRRWGVLLVVVALIAGPGCIRRARKEAARTTTVALPATPVGEQLGWFIAEINKGPQGLPDAELDAHFDSSFLAAVPPAKMRGISVVSFAASRTWRLDEFIGVPTATSASGILVGDGPNGRKWKLSIVVAPTEGDHKITGLRISNPPPTPVTSWRDLDRQLGPIASRVSLSASTVSGTKCKVGHPFHSDLRQGIGSALKLYVLGAVAEEIRAGRLSWDDEITVDDKLKSIPSGKMQDEPAGTRHPVRYVASQMISISDNTATDHLIARVGREKVEAAQPRLGHRAPAANTPFLSTRELTVLKYGDPGLKDRYIGADEAGKRALLVGDVARQPLPPLSAMSSFGDSRLEWFATPDELCRALATLRDWSAQAQLNELGGILSANPGVDFGPRFKVLAFKGGSEPGVLAFAFLLQDKKGKIFGLAATFHDPVRPIDTDSAVAVLQNAATLLPK